MRAECVQRIFLALLKQRFTFLHFSYIQSCCHVVLKLQLKSFVNDNYVVIKVII